MTKKLVIIDNYDSFTYNLIQILEELNSDYTVLKNDSFLIEEIDRFSKILISPGPGIPSEAGLVKKVITHYALTKSILGICLGHQAISEVFGGILTNLERVRHGLTVKVKLTEPADYLFENLPSEFKAGVYHSWAVSPDCLPDCLKVTSHCEDNIIMSVAHRIYDVRGVQFHPESIMSEYGKQIIRNWLEH